MKRESRGRLIAALSTGILLVLATPPFHFGFLGWFAIIPLMIGLEKVEGRREAYLLGFVAGLIYYTGTVYWIAWNSGTDMAGRIGSGGATVLVLSAWLGVITLFYRMMLLAYGRNGHYFAPLLWMASEAIWHHGELAFPWPLIALTQGYYLPILQLAAVGSTALLTGWVVMVNGIIAAGRSRRVTGLVVLVLIGATWAVGAIRQRAVEQVAGEESVGRCALVQGNIDAEKKWELGPMYSLNIYQPLTQGLVDDHPDLVVWPETAAPVYLQQDFRWRRYMQQFVDSLGFSLATGANYAEFSEKGRTPFNTSFLVRPGGNGKFDRYAKIHLVPFGERVPFQWLLPSLGNLNLGQAEFKPGDEVKIWRIHGKNGDFNVAPMICYESIFPSLGRKAVLKGADVLLNMTNDGWFDHTGELEQHLLLSRIRAIETGRGLVRATNTGISAICGPSGKILQSLPEEVRGALVMDMPRPVHTPFLSWGWAMGLASIPLILLVGLLAAWRLLKRRNTAGEVQDEI